VVGEVAGYFNDIVVLGSRRAARTAAVHDTSVIRIKAVTSSVYQFK
jgi:hypothetical protein